MATTDVLTGEWTAAALRPVARWVRETGPDGRARLVMVWAVPQPMVPAQVSVAA